MNNNGSYTMATKPIKFLELHYTMTQFLIFPIFRQAGPDLFRVCFRVCFMFQGIRKMSLLVKILILGGSEGRCDGLMVSALVARSSGLDSSPGRGHCVVFVGKPTGKPCLRRLSPQYDRQSKFWCPNETIR